MSHSPPTTIRTTMARKVFFSSAHFYWVNDWSDEKNKAVFGKCANRYGHGHDFTLECFLTGEIDPRSGLIANLTDVDREMKAVVEPLDHRHLNHEVEFFKDVVPTTEALAGYLYHQLEARFSGWGLEIEKVRVFENSDIWAEYGPSRSLVL